MVSCEVPLRSVPWNSSIVMRLSCRSFSFIFSCFRARILLAQPLSFLLSYATPKNLLGTDFGQSRTKFPRTTSCRIPALMTSQAASGASARHTDRHHQVLRMLQLMQDILTSPLDRRKEESQVRSCKVDHTYPRILPPLFFPSSFSLSEQSYLQNIGNYISYGFSSYLPSGLKKQLPSTQPEEAREKVIWLNFDQYDLEGERQATCRYIA